MTPSAFARFIQADPRVYDRKNITLDPRWIAKQERYAELTGGMGQDYDYRLATKRDDRGHGGDVGKLPWHPTFSTQSAFSTHKQPGGVWGQGTFQPTPRQDTPRFRDYMQEVEPNIQIIRN